MTRCVIHVIDDDAPIREGLAALLGDRYDVRTFASGEEALAAARQGPPDLALLDIQLPGADGLEILGELRTIAPDTPVLMVTGNEDLRTAVVAMRGGAHDYVAKPIHPESLERAVHNALQLTELRREVQRLQERRLVENVPQLIGESDAMQDVLCFVELVARSTTTPVLIVGETGTGKEIIARAVHYRSALFRGALVAVNCAAIPVELIESELFGYAKGAFTGASPGGKRGLIEEADGGTLFLDELGDLSLSAQAKLLRFLETGDFYRVGDSRRREARVRLISATNRDLQERIEAGRFRADLYYRIGVVTVRVPSLDERPDDILPLAKHFLVGFAEQFGKTLGGFTGEAANALRRYHWKGNIRELRNVVERAALVCSGGTIDTRHLGLGGAEPGTHGPAAPSVSEALPPFPPEGVDYPALAARFERHYLEGALRHTDGNESRAARLLNLNHHTYRYRLRKLREQDA